MKIKMILNQYLNKFLNKFIYIYNIMIDWKSKYLKYKIKYNILNTNLKRKLIAGTNNVTHLPKVTLYAEDHYNAREGWKEFISSEKQKYELIIIEKEVVIPLIDLELIPKLNLELEHIKVDSDSTALKELREIRDEELISKTNPEPAKIAKEKFLAKAMKFKANRKASADILEIEEQPKIRIPEMIEGDIRSLLEIPIESSLANILINLFVSFVEDPNLEDIMGEIMQFLEIKFIRNLLNPSPRYLNFIANLKEKLTNDEYNYIKELYHKIINTIKIRTDSIIYILSNISTLYTNTGEMIDVFQRQIDIIMFEMPALLNDIYLTGLIMSNKEHNIMVIYGEAHIHNINKMLGDFYKIDFKIFDSKDERR